jgi:hypothetical protein
VLNGCVINKYNDFFKRIINLENITEIEGVGNSYGSLHVKKQTDKYYMKVFCEVSKQEWKEISGELYLQLIALNRKEIK